MSCAVTCSVIFLNIANARSVIQEANFHAVMLHLTYSEAAWATECWRLLTHQKAYSILFPTVASYMGHTKWQINPTVNFI